MSEIEKNFINKNILPCRIESKADINCSMAKSPVSGKLWLYNVNARCFLQRVNYTSNEYY